MTFRFTGGCMCGAVRYECETDPIAMGNYCHCRDCQRATGSAFAAAVLVPISAVNISGEVNYYEAIGDSGGIVRRGFCPNCGARLFGKAAASPDGSGVASRCLGHRGSAVRWCWLREPRQWVGWCSRYRGGATRSMRWR
jgi:hypothetical protein